MTEVLKERGGHVIGNKTFYVLRSLNALILHWFVCMTVVILLFYEIKKLGNYGRFEKEVLTYISNVSH